METTSGKEENLMFLDRTSRATRGKRMTRLLDDEVEEDEAFWNQEALKEEEHDVEYEDEGEVADVFDSDFDEDESEPEEVEKEPEDRDRPKKRLFFPGKTLAKSNKKKKAVQQLETDIEEVKTPEESTPSDHHDGHEDIEEERTIRKSTRTAVVVKQAERDAMQAVLQATARPIKRKKGEEKRMTQEEMLLEAAQTEIVNLRNLERVLAREEEVKKRAVVDKAVYTGPQIRYISKDGYSFLEYMNGASFESEISTMSTPYPEKAVCAVTGLPAKYRDPKTGLPYATKEAFKVIRQGLSDERKRMSPKRSVGFLLDTLPGQGFSTKQKRSLVPKKESSFFRPHARFRRYPRSASEDSE